MSDDLSWLHQKTELPKFNFIPSQEAVTNGMGKLDNPYGYNSIFQNYGTLGLNNGTGNTNSWNNGFLGSEAFGNTLKGFGIGLDFFNGITGYKRGKDFLNLAKDNLAFQQNLTNESYNNTLKQWNGALADKIRQRAGFETGNSHAYDDEIAANQARRGETGYSSADYLNYKRSANAV